jgi:hypothetical protein
LNLPLRSILAVALAATPIPPAVQARKSKSVVQQVVDADQSTNSTTLPAAGTIEVALRPMKATRT